LIVGSVGLSPTFRTVSPQNSECQQSSKPFTSSCRMIGITRYQWVSPAVTRFIGCRGFWWFTPRGPQHRWRGGGSNCYRLTYQHVSQEINFPLEEPLQTAQISVFVAHQAALERYLCRNPPFPTRLDRIFRFCPAIL
jgi:hypothetical protein